MKIDVRHDGDSLQRRWRLTQGIRRALAASPIKRGRWHVARATLFPLFPDDDRPLTFDFDGKSLVVQYREGIARQTLAFGPFEAVEVQTLAGLVKSGSTVLDVGANIGYFTVALSGSAAASIIAIEPLDVNLIRLRATLDANAIKHVQLIESAVGAEAGELNYACSSDGAFAHVVPEPVPRGGTWTVRTLDDVWVTSGRPTVSAVKIDVEGHEPAVLRGASELLATHPALLMEANSPGELAALRAELPSNYRLSQPTGFMPWNYLFTT